jgi:hypothetical protein
MVGSCLGTYPTGTRTGISAVYAENGIEKWCIRASARIAIARPARRITFRDLLGAQ